MSVCDTCRLDDCATLRRLCHCLCHDVPEKEAPPLATFWAIMRGEGPFTEQSQYFKASTSSRGPSWVKDLGTARIYSKLSHAKAKVTALANAPWNAGKPIPVIVEFVVNDVRVIDQKERVAEVQAKKAREASAHDRWVHRLQVKNARDNVKNALLELARLTGDASGRKHGPDCGCKSCVGM
jgi:hypothetical protein